MDVCKIANKEKKICKQEALEGLYRMIEVNMKYKMGEFDLEFKDGKLYMQDYDTKVEAKEMGTVKTTGHSDTGGVIFEVTGWKADPAIWPYDTMFGVYHTKPGESQTYTFLEFAIADKAIKTLDGALTGNGRYWVGVSCFDKKNCDFKKASPDMKMLQYTPRPDLANEEVEYMQF